MTAARAWLLASFLLSAAALVQPAHAAPLGAETGPPDAPVAAAPSAHQGQAFAVSKGAKARIVEPDGRVAPVVAGSDLVAPTSIAEMRAKTAIARLIRTEVIARATRPSPSANDAPLSKLQEP